MIQIKDKQFQPYITRQEIDGIIKKLSSEIATDLRHLDPLVCPVLSGSFIFAADLVRALVFDVEVSFVKYHSYDGTSSTGQVVEDLPFTDRVNGRHVLIVEDIIETGYSMKTMLDRLRQFNPASVSICTLVHKPNKLKVPITINYLGRNIDDAFIVGYGFDYDGYGRTLPDIYSLISDFK